ncbi:spore coat U domain-containing protein [Samsonia erythrinae]|uniref:Spore coat protein U-like protein n=1 Tax=Samsonia erythrinae TaxID=160434 RepID=A0A4R3VL91_9GAMM|nr:spore coat U domain-containing protein [Samsonia erythrinae]TCV07043.1 spore coat protein U-like protein [Samsonia erythrinae]
MTAKRATLTLLASAITLFGVSTTANSATIDGQIPVTVTITSSCSVENGGSGSGATWGTIDFGTHPDLATNIDGQTTGNGGNGISVSCSVGTPATLTFDAGTNASSTLRQLAPGSGDYNIPYRLYSDSARASEIPINSTTGIEIVSNGNAQAIPVYARILSSDQTVSSPTAGTYTDTITATIEW